MSEARPLLLVVDDEPGVVKLIAKFARKVGFDVATAASGEEALQALRGQKAAVALVDLRHRARLPGDLDDR